MPLAATIYLATNLLNGDQYVGVTRFAVEKRWAEHVNKARRNPAVLFHRAIRKYGADSFAIIAVASCLDIASAGAVEQDIIKQIKPRYNLTNGGEVTSGRRAPEVVEKIRISNTGKKRTQEQRKSMSVSRRCLYAAHPELHAKVSAGLVLARANVDKQKRIEAVKSAQKICREDPEFRRKNTEQLNSARLNISSEFYRKQGRRLAEINRKRVECTSLNTVFDSVSEAAEGTGLSISGVSRVCRGDRARANGLVFKFI